MIIRLVTFLLHLYSLLIINSVAEALTEELKYSSPDSLDSALPLTKLLCSIDSNEGQGYVDCSQNGTFFTPGNCATYDEDKEVLSVFLCPEVQPNMIVSGYIKLSSNLSQLNDSVCGLLNRKVICAASVLMALASQ